MEEEEHSLLLDIFDTDREGLKHIGERICLYLDYHSLVAFKRCCSSVHEFLSASSVESKVLKRKLHKEWSHGEPRVSHLDKNYFSSQAPVKCVKLVNDEVLASTVKSVYGFNLSSTNDKTDQTENGESPTKHVNEEDEEAHESTKLAGNVLDGMKLGLNFPSNSLNAKINSEATNSSEGNHSKVFTNCNENLEKNQITEFDVLGEYLIGGNNNGILSVWDLDTSELLNSKQLFGIITGVKCLEQEGLIVTSHAGKGYDIGCVSIRRLLSPEQLEVVWSVYQDIMPVFCIAATNTYILTLEWLGTFDLVHVGSATLYTRHGEHMFLRRDFSDSRAVETRRSAAGLFKNLEQLNNLRFSSAGIFK